MFNVTKNLMQPRLQLSHVSCGKRLTVMKKRLLFFPVSTLCVILLYRSFFTESIPRSLQPVVSRLQYAPPCCISDYFDLCSQQKCQPCPTMLQLESEAFEYSEPETQIYFHETSGSSTLTWRQACSIESAVRHNPDLNIQLYMVSPSIDFNSPQIATILEYKNVNIESLDLVKYFNNSPFEAWLHCSQWWNGPYAVSHLSDALRYLTLWKFGGYYFDLDVVFLKSVDRLRNFIALESSDAVGAGAIHIRHKHPLIEEIAQRFVPNYKKYEWGSNGPGLFTQVLLDVCKKRLQETDNCFGFRVLPSELVYPVRWQDWHYYFDARRANEVMEAVKSSFAVHVWNKHSDKALVDITSQQPYSQLARKNCPRLAKLKKNW